MEYKISQEVLQTLMDMVQADSVNCVMQALELKNSDCVIGALYLIDEQDRGELIDKQLILELCPRFGSMKELDPVIETLVHEGYLRDIGEQYIVNWQLIERDAK